MTDAERESLQKRVEMLHRQWTKDRDYLPPPTVGKLADLDPAVLVTPPKGRYTLSVGSQLMKCGHSGNARTLDIP